MIRCFTFLFAAFVGAGIASAAPAEPDFYEDVYPFLKANCISCHNKTTTKADLNMETPALMKKGGDSGPSIIPGKSSESLVVEASMHEFDLEMPPKNNKTDAVQLTTQEIAVLKKWIDLGAKDSVRQERKIVWQPLAPGVHPIYTLAMTKDGRYATCSRSNQIFLYDLATRQFISQIADVAEQPAAAHKALVHSLAFSPDGTRLASGGFREVKIWKKTEISAATRKANATLAAQVSAISSDGSKIVSANKNRALLVQNAADGAVIQKFDGIGKTAIKLLSISPDGAKVAVFSDGWNLNVLNLADGKQIASQETPDLTLSKLAKDGAVKLATAVKAESAANAEVTKLKAGKAAAVKELATVKAEIAKAPTPELQKKLTHANAKLGATTQAETKAIAASKTVLTQKSAAEKSSKEAAEKLNQSPKIVIQALAWTADGKAVVTAGDDKVARIWTLPASPGSGFPTPRELKGATGSITALAIGQSQVFAASTDNKIRIWNVSDGKLIKEIAAAGIVSLDASPTGKLLATGGADSAIRIWDVATGKQTVELRGSVSTSKKIAELDWAIARQTLEQAFQKTVVTKTEAQNKALDILLQKAKDAIVAMNKKLPVNEKAIKPTEEARAAEQKKVDEAKSVIAKAPEGKTDAAMEKALKAAQDKLITAVTAENSAVAAFKAVQANITDSEAQVKRITETKVKNAKNIAASKAASEAAKKLQTTATTDLAALKKTLTTPAAKPLAVKFSANEQKVAAIFADGSLTVWASVSGIPVEQVSGVATSAASLALQKNGAFAACSADGTFTTTNLNSQWKLERTLGGEKNHEFFADRVNTLEFSPDGKILATGSGEPSRSGDISLFDAATGKWKSTWQERHSDCVVSLDFSPDGKLLASGAADKIARVTDIATGKQVNLFEGHTHHVTSVAFRADGRVLATAGADGVVNSWDMILGERKKKIIGWTKEVTSLQFIGATNKIVTSAGDNLIRIVNDDGAQIRSIAKLPEFMQAAASTPDGVTVIGGGEDSFLRIWDGTNGKELAAFGSN
ncbi:MAG: WD40 domain-containing protein [Verrucomicrobiales bacterium]